MNKCCEKNREAIIKLAECVDVLEIGLVGYEKASKYRKRVDLIKEILDFPAPQPAEENWEETMDLFLEDFADNIYYEGDPKRTDGTNEAKIKSFISQLLKEVEAKKEPCAGWTETCGCYKQARQNAYEEIETALNKLPRTIASYSNDHEVVDICEIQKVLKSFIKENKTK